MYDVSIEKQAKMLSIIEGPAALSKFGASLAVGKPFGKESGFVLAVGAPSIGKFAVFILFFGSYFLF